MRFRLILAVAALGGAVFMGLTIPAASQQPLRPKSTTPSSVKPASGSLPPSPSRRTDMMLPSPTPPARRSGSELPSLYSQIPELEITSTTITTPNCLVTLIEDVEVPSPEQGQLMKLAVKDGSSVKKGDMVAQVDDEKAKMAVEVSRNQMLAAEAEAKNPVSVAYATAAWKVAQAEVKQALEANAQMANTFPKSEVLERQLKERQYELQIKQAEHELEVNALKANEKKAELDAANLDVTRRAVISPLDGVVVKRFRHEGEWLRPGDPIVRIVRADLLRVEGMLDATKILPAEVQDQPVTITVTLPNREPATLEGRVAFVNPIVEAGMRFLVVAEVENRQESGYWVLRPGLPVAMKIQRKR